MKKRATSKRGADDQYERDMQAKQRAAASCASKGPLPSGLPARWITRGANVLRPWF